MEEYIHSSVLYVHLLNQADTCIHTHIERERERGREGGRGRGRGREREGEGEREGGRKGERERERGREGGRDGGGGTCRYTSHPTDRGDVQVCMYFLHCIWYYPTGEYPSYVINRLTGELTGLLTHTEYA